MLKHREIYTLKTLNDFLSNLTDLPIIKTRTKGSFYNIPCSFDIETTSTFNDAGDKFATMYIWMFGINGFCIIGRTWGDFHTMIDALVDHLQLGTQYKLLCYVHNLSFEFGFIEHQFDWESVFAISTRKPIYARTTIGIEFRCSYILTSLSLENVAKNLTKYKINKLHDLDYMKIRNYLTPMTKKEIKYCLHDIKIVMCLIDERIEQDGDITKIPLTSTGYCRIFCRKKCLPDKRKYPDDYWEYHNIMKELIIGSEEEYYLIRSAFMGGFTHTNPHYSGETLFNSGSIDFTSAYPFQMVAKCGYPMSKGKWRTVTSKEELEHLCNKYCTIFEIEFINLEAKVTFENYIPASHCNIKGGSVINNGRIYWAENVITTITEIDWDIIKKMYKWDGIRIGRCITYRRSYLPTAFVEAILEMYKQKTTLKDATNGDPYLEQLYMYYKALLNACFGMTCTDINKIVYKFDKDWFTEKQSTAEQLNKYNNDWNRFLFYPWGLYVTAHCRHALIGGIFAFNKDYIYSDTDSIKGINLKNHMDYINWYNSQCEKQLLKAMEYHNLPFELVAPVDKNGKSHMLGCWDIESIDSLEQFRAYGAKRYCYIEKGKLKITVSGLNKKVATPYLLKKYGTAANVVDNFKDGLFVSEDGSGKLTHTYNDNEAGAYVTDYLGNTAYCYEKSFCHLYPQSFEMSVSGTYKEFIRQLRSGELLDIIKQKR